MTKTAQMMLDKFTFLPDGDIEEVEEAIDESASDSDSSTDEEDEPVSLDDEDADFDIDNDVMSISLPEDVEIEEIDEQPVKNEEREYIFKLAPVPGADDLEDDIEEEDEVEEVEEKANTPKDDWDWEAGGLPNFLSWVEGMFKRVPKHSGKDTTGVERVIAFFKRFNSEISKAMSKDYKREIDAEKLEQARDEIHNGIKRLEARLEKLNKRKYNKKKAENYQELVKNAETSNIGRQQIEVPYLISIVARACIEATVQGGKDIEDVFKKLAKDFELDKRERYQAVNLLKDFGYPFLFDRVNFEQDIEPSDSTKPSEYVTQYYA